MARTTRVPDQFANGGAVHQEGSLPIYQCNTCLGQVVWATSSKTGRKYLANIRTGYLDQRFYNKRDYHDCDNPNRRGYMGIDPEVVAAANASRKDTP